MTVLGPILVNGVRTNEPRAAEVVSLGGGGFVIVWEEFGNGFDRDILFRIFNADGTVLSGIKAVKFDDNSAQLLQSVAATADGGFAVAWDDRTADRGFYTRTFDSEGNATSPQVQITHFGGRETDAINGGNRISLADGMGPTLLTLVSDGYFGVPKFGHSIDSTFGMLAFAGPAVPASGPNRIANALVETEEPTIANETGGFGDIAFLQGGTALAAWQFLFNSALPQFPGGVYVQRVNTNGAELGKPVLISEQNGGAPEVIGLTNGRALVVYGGVDPENSGFFAVFGRIVDATGTPIGSEFQIKNASPDYDIAPTKGGGFLFVSDATGVVAFSPNGTPLQPLAPIILPSGDTVMPLDAAVLNNGQVVTIGSDFRRADTGNGFDFDLFAILGSTPKLGTAGGDQLLGGITADAIYGFLGDDTLSGARNSDVLKGGRGADLVFAGNGRDTVEGGPGWDTIFGGNGDDDLHGGNGTDRLFGGSGADELSGGNGADRIFGDLGLDLLSGGNGDDLIFGGKGRDTINGGAGVDTVTGGPGSDTFLFEDGDDWISIQDFNPAVDQLIIDRNALTFTVSPTNFVAVLSEITPEGILSDLGGNNTILFADLTTKEGLADAISFA